MAAYLYTLDGTSIDELAKETKKAAKAEGQKLKDVRDTAAIKHGFVSWQKMIENAVEIEDEAFSYDVIILRQGPDRYRLHLEALRDLSGYDRELAMSRPLSAKKDLLREEDGSLSYEVDFNTEETMDDPRYALSDKFSLPSDDLGYVMDNIEVCDDRDELIALHSELVSLLAGAGLFQNLDEIEIDDAEHEAILELKSRKIGRSVKDRILFNTGSFDGRHHVIDDEKRVFANLLDNGDVVLCNFAYPLGDDFLWKILPRGEFDLLVKEMHDIHGPNAAFNGHGEIWMHDRVLAKPASA